MEEGRPFKRARQACDPCRRKKSRCPGERPICSYCERLGQGQDCRYNDDQDAVSAAPSRRMEERVANLEGKLDQVLERLLHVPTTVSASHHHLSPPGEPTPWNGTASSETSQTRSNRRLSHRPSTAGEDSTQKTEAHEAASLYLTWVHRQPVQLFDRSDFLRTISTRDPQVLLAIKAISLRFPPGALTAPVQDSVRTMARQSRRLVMERIGDGQVNLATLQALCLLSMNDLADGQTVQAGAKLVLANNLANTVPVDATLGEAQEFAYCKESITLLMNLHGSILPGSQLDDSALRWRMPSAVSQPMRDTDLITCMAQLSEAWHMARIYASSRVSPEAPPPWHPLSDYSIVTQRHMDIDCSVPIKYRFAGSKFIERSQEELQGNRHYWGPWFYVQFVYAGIVCLLNHPYLLSLRLRGFRHTLPQTFIHQSFKLISRQSGWITYFVDLLEERDFVISDPTLAHCVAVVATIHLQHSFVSEPGLRERSQAGFKKCIRFLRSVGTIWPHVSVMADNLEKLERSVVEVPTTGTRASEEPIRHRSIDVNLLRNILIYERAGQPDAAPDRSAFGGNLVPAATNPDSDYEGGTVDYGLVGSVGIEGHSRNKAKKTPLYPPEHVSPAQTVESAVAVDGPNDNYVAQGAAQAQDWSMDDQYSGRVILESDLEGMSFQADDFGRAINGWMNLQLG